MKSKIAQAATTEELETIARRYGYCDVTDFSSFPVSEAKRILRILARTLYRFPKSSGQLNYVGSYDGFHALFQKISRGDSEALRSLGLKHILDESSATGFAECGMKITRELREGGTGSLAAFVSFGHLCNGLLFDAAGYKEHAFFEAITEIRNAERTGFHPRGCNTFESVVYHEVGHILDHVCQFSLSREGAAFLSRYDPLKVSKGLSRYATTSPQELVAEAVSEVFASPSPRGIATEVFDELCKFYRRIP